MNKEIAQIPVEVKIERFDLIFSKATPQSLHQLKTDFPYLFPIHYSDSIWIEKMKDTLQAELEDEVFKVYTNFKAKEEEIELLFKHFKYYFPKFKEPKVVTLISDVDYRNSVVYADSLLLIGLDNFLGESHYFYSELPLYVSKNLKPDQLLPKIAEQIALKYIPAPSHHNLLELMIYYGKLQYLKEMLLPTYDAHSIMGYSYDDMSWAVTNEAEIWRYFIERELLFNTDPHLASRFIYPAPFSKFYLELDNESPGMLGQYMGWQIVKSFANKNDLSLEQLLQTNADILYKKSKFKPRK